MTGAHNHASTMPEVLVIIVVPIIAAVIYVTMWIRSRDPALHDPREQFARSQRQVSWLEERLAMARREQWGGEMVASIAAEFETTTLELAKAIGAQCRASRREVKTNAPRSK